MWVFSLLSFLVFIISAVFIAERFIRGKESLGLTKYLKFTIPLTVILFMIGKMFFYAHPGHYYVVQNGITGNQSVITSQGFKPKVFGQVIEFKQVLTIKFSPENNGEYSGWDKPHSVRFNDAVVAEVSGSFRVRIPSHLDLLKKLAIEYRSQENLVNASLLPTVREVLRNSARMISAQDYIVGKGGIFEQAVIDQLQNGIYELEIQTSRDTSKEPIQTDETRYVDRSNVVRTEVVKIKGPDGKELHKQHAFIEYGIEVTQSVIDNVDPEQKFKDLLAQQRDAAGKSNIARQEAQKAEFEKQKIVAQGEAAKAQVRVDQEKKQVEILIESETAMKKKETEVKTNRFALEAEELAAKATKIRADAEAYQRTAVMKADGALEKRLAAKVEIAKAIAEAIKGTPLVPTTLITSGGENGGSSISSAVFNLLAVDAAKNIGKSSKAKDLDD